MLKFICHVVVLSVWLHGPCLLAADLYVAAPASGGSDANPGTLAAPFATIQRAANVAVPGDTVFIRSGTYRETITPSASGTANARITYQNYPGEVVTVSGADVMDSATWTLDAGNVHSTPLAASFFTSTCNQALQVFVDGEMVNLARWPNVTTKTNAYPSGTAPPVSISHPAKSVTTSFVSKTRDSTAKLTTGVVTDTALPPKPAGFYDGAEICFQPNNSAWSWIFSGLVTQVPANGTQITFTSRSESGKDFNQSTYDAASRYYLFNKKEFLDTPGEWWHDRSSGRLYLWAPASANPATRVVEVKKRDYAFNFTNRSHLTVRGLRLFACSITTDTASGGSALGYDASGNVIYPWRGAGTTAASTGVILDGLHASYLNHFTDVSGHFFLQWGTASGLVLSGTGHSLLNSTIEKTAGNGVALQGHRHTVFNNVFLDTAYAGTDAAAINTVAAGVGTDHDIGYNTIRRTGRSGITPRSFGNSNAAGGQFLARIHHNDVSYFGIQDWDVGGLYNAVSDAKFLRIDHNLFYEGRGFISAGVYLDYVKNCIIDHNVVWNVEWGIKVHGESGGLNNTLVYNNTSSVRNLSATPYGPFAIGNGNGTNVGTVLRNNVLHLVTPPAANGYQAITGGTAFSGAEIAANLAWDGIANSGTDPRFANRATTLDATGVSYQLQTGSAAIDAGSVIGSYVRDGITVPAFPDAVSGSAPDAGAYEFGLTPWTAGASATQSFAPEFTLVPGIYTNAVQVGLTSPTLGATIRYTLDGSTPTAGSGLIYTGPISISSSTTVRALATTAGLTDSQVVTGVYQIFALDIRGNNTLIPPNSTVPRLADHTDFGSVEANFASSTRIFTLTNLSAATLDLTGTSPLSLAGSAAFTIVNQPALNVAPGASTTFGIRFFPAVNGAAAATVRIAQASLPGGGYDFAISGLGLSAQPTLSLHPATLVINRPATSITTAPLVISNTGRGPLTWSLSAPSSAGLYTIADSTSGGPAFSWRNTAGGGTTILANEDEAMSSAIPLGFTFPYLGGSYTQLYASSNGFITFLSGQVPAFGNDTLPSTNCPAQTIALFWDDLIEDGSSTITWKQLDSQTFGLTYQNVAQYGNPSTQRITAQVLLKSDGRVILQYKDNSIPTGYTIGYQSTTSRGHTIAFNNTFLGTGSNLNRALTLQQATSWITSVTPSSGTLPPGASQIVDIALDTAGLVAGQTNNTTVTLTTNDPAALSTPIPVSLTVSNLPSTPAGLRLTSNSSTEIGLTWADVGTNETGIKVERSENGVSGWSQIALPAAGSTAYLDQGLPSAAIRYYRVRATNPAGDSAWSATVTNAAPPPQHFIYQPFADASGTVAGSLAAVPGITATSGSGSVQDNAALVHPGVVTSGRGFASANSSRFFMTLDTSLPALASYVANGRIGGSNTGVLYVSWLARGINAQEGNTVEFRTGTLPDNETAISIGTTFGNAFIRAMSANALNGGIVNYANSTLAPSAGTDRYVAKFTFGATTRVDVFINQSTEGTPTVTTNGFGQFNVVGFAKFGTAAAPAIDEFRFAPTYAAALPGPPAHAAPSLTIVSPPAGPTSGGTAVILTGVDFNGVTGVTFGGVPATDLTLLSSTTLTCVTPARTAGVFSVALTSLGGTATLPDSYTFQLPSLIRNFRLAHGLAADGSQDTATPAGDGVANLLKFAFNMIGTGAGQAVTINDSNTSIIAADGIAGLPFGYFDEATGKLQIIYIRRTQASNPGINYAVEFSDNTTSWSVAPSNAESVSNIDDAFERVTVIDISNSPGQRFGRVRVTAP